ncbi:MAG: bifunctional UDP-N-acetylglucosamine diphosphorylase/glucosamine-1-phosphate N-acetyltransferase GlmU [Acidobacteria bacterium]|nr:bifunctional UDP-N-acetylglucosamine diphosphorylase/glucosamine-1-phosphate N-acetyltransferase GlmU [Acidobacteriota bacterium]
MERTRENIRRICLDTQAEKAQFGIVIMAAGKGTRLKSARPKVLHQVGGKALLLHVIDAALTAVPASAITVVIGHQSEMVRAAVEAIPHNAGIRFVEQTEQRGTGHALQQVKTAFAGTTPPEHLLVLSGDVPLIRPETIAQMRAFHLEKHADMTILTAFPTDATGYGRIVRKQDGSEVFAIVEQKSLSAEQLSIQEINSGIYVFRTAALFSHLDELNANNSAGEFYLTDVAGLMVAAGERVVALAAENVDEVLGANTIAEMMHLDAALRLSTTKRLMAAGVTIFRPDTCVIDEAVEIGPDTVLEPFTQVLGETSIGSNCRIRSFSVIQNSTLGDNVLVRNGCILDSATVENGAFVGPYAHLRPGSEIGEEAHVGNFVETKKVKLGKKSKANHLTYLGDAEVGNGVNIGAGVITCNYDGVNKHLTRIGDGVFVGSDSTLVAPVAIGDGGYVAAGSCVTEDVPADALAVARSRQMTKEGWAATKREKLRRANS